jgi:hypothetical protein
VLLHPWKLLIGPAIEKPVPMRTGVSWTCNVLPVADIQPASRSQLVLE